MKRFLLITSLIFSCLIVHGQSITMNDLTNLTNLGNDDAYNYLTSSKKFKLTTELDTNGLKVQTYRDTKGDKANTENITVGLGTKGANGFILRKVLYKTNQQKNIEKLMNQAFDARMALTFRGNDQYRYIFIYNSYLYNISIFINRDQSSSLVEIKQKELPGY